jgi:hypothetical protein
MQTRRELIVGATAALVMPRPAGAVEQCPAQGMPPGTCSVWLDPDRLVPVLQRRSQWCWAACIEMICQWYGVPLGQESIVQRVYGDFVNWPGDDRVLTEWLNNDWVADDGTEFSMRARVFSPAMGLGDVSNELVIDDLRNERPLLNGSGTHATVVARVDYIDTATGPQVGQVHVIDPYPGAAAPPWHARILNQAEMTAVNFGGSLRYLASVRVDL